MTNQALIFDMDGVLVDSEHLYKKMNLALFQELGATVSQEEYNSFIGIAANKMWGFLKERYGISETIEELKQIEKERKYQLLDQLDIQSFEGIKELLVEAQAKGFKMAIASSSPKKNIELVAQKLGFEPFFEVLLSGEEVAFGKPEPDIFLKAADLLAVPPKAALVIEDSRNGAIAAKKAGMLCVGFRSPHSGNQQLEMCDWITHDFSAESRRHIFDLLATTNS